MATDNDGPSPTIQDLRQAKVQGNEVLGPMLLRYGCRVRNWIRQAGVKSEHDIEDLESDVNRKLLKTLPKTEFDNVVKFRAWVKQVATNLAIDFLRRAQRNPGKRHIESVSSPTGSTMDPPARQRGPVSQIHGAEQMRRIEEMVRAREALIAKLPTPDREILDMHERQGMTFASIAEAQNRKAAELGISKAKTEDSVRMKYGRLLEKVGPAIGVG